MSYAFAPDTVAQASVPSPSEPTTGAEAARYVGLRHTSDAKPGIVRRRAGRAFSYRDASGQIVRDTATLDRIHRLAIPPAWRNGWICPSANGHVQATGIDARGRKQYRYHPKWRALREDTKYGRMVAFGRALPAIRRRVDADLGLDGLPREKILATIVRLLETTLIRVGNREYARENKSFGLTTLRSRHVAVEGATVHFEFRAKSGKMRVLDLKDRKLAAIVKRCRELPGYELFQYVDRDGERHSVTSGDVNRYLREASGGDFTAKDFRTWAGTVLAALALSAFEEYDSEAAAKHNITRAIEDVAGRLGNTVSICRKCYVHPDVFDAYLDGTLVAGLKQEVDRTLANDLDHLRPEELAVLAFLHGRLARREKRR